VTVAGTGRKAASSDGGAATEASLLTPRNVAVDGAGNLYFSEFEGHRVRKIAPDGRISTVAGTGLAGFRGDGSPAASAQLSYPAGLAIDRFGSLHIADSGNNRVRKIFDSGVIGTVLGGSSSTALATPLAIAVDLNGTVYASDSSFVVRAYTAAGKWSDFAGSSAPGFSGDGGPALKATITAVHDLASDLSGNLWIADSVRLRKVDLTGAIQTVAGDGYQRALGDGGPATGGILFQPSAIALDSAGNLYIADAGTQRVRQVLASGTMATLAGTGTPGAATDGSAANAGALNGPMGVAVDPAGNLLIADTYNHRIQQVASDRRMRTVAGTGTGGMGPDAMLPLATQLRSPRAICINRAGILFIVDTANHRVLRAPPGALLETAAGNGSPGDTGDGGPARLAQLNQPGACTVDSYGNLFIADTGSHRIRKVTASGTVSTVAGTGEAGGSGDEGPATAARLSAPRGVAVDDSGDIFIADSGNHRIRQVTPDGAIHSIAGHSIAGNTAGFAGDGGAATAAQLNSPGGLFLDGAGALYFADTNNNRVRRLIPDSVVPPAPLVLPPTISAVNALSMRQGPVAPGEIVSIFGQGIGPEAAVTGNFDAAGLLANLVGGVEVRFDGVAAPIFYAQASQINVQVPYTVTAAGVTRLEVWVQGKAAGTLDLPVVAASPALLPLAVNQDGSLNGETAPALRGTVLTFYATGEGLTDGPNITGKAAEAPYPRPRLPVTLAVAGVAAELLFAGSAPGMVGVMQINARIPGGFVAPGQAVVELSVGSAAASAITIWLK
jgi:uncharacterized protein (TIGR03437 family)